MFEYLKYVKKIMKTKNIFHSILILIGAVMIVVGIVTMRTGMAWMMPWVGPWYYTLFSPEVNESALEAWEGANRLRGFFMACIGAGVIILSVRK